MTFSGPDRTRCRQISKVGLRSLGVAVSGPLIPLLIGFAAASLQGNDWRPALVVGLILSPTSAGIVLNVLSKGKVLQTESGQLIIAAAILDDIIALVLLSELEVVPMCTVPRRR